MRKVLVLNTTYEPLNVCSARRALVLLFKGKAEVLEQSGAAFRSERATYELPHVIRLQSYVHVPRRAAASRISRRAVFARDRHLTVDHVVPRCKGGPDTWDNLVTSCAPCNRKKGDRPPQQAGLRLMHKPRPPEPATGGRRIRAARPSPSQSPSPSGVTAVSLARAQASTSARLPRRRMSRTTIASTTITAITAATITPVFELVVFWTAAPFCTAR